MIRKLAHGRRSHRNRDRQAPSEVAAYAADPDHAPVWYQNIATVEWQTPRPLKVGSKVAFVARFLGKRLAYTYEVVEWTAGERMVMRTSQGPFPMETTYTWASEGQGTRMTLRNRGEASGFARVPPPDLPVKDGARGPIQARNCQVSA